MRRAGTPPEPRLAEACELLCREPRRVGEGTAEVQQVDHRVLLAAATLNEKRGSLWLPLSAVRKRGGPSRVRLELGLRDLQPALAVTDEPAGRGVFPERRDHRRAGDVRLGGVEYRFAWLPRLFASVRSCSAKRSLNRNRLARPRVNVQIPGCRNWSRFDMLRCYVTPQLVVAGQRAGDRADTRLLVADLEVVEGIDASGVGRCMYPLTGATSAIRAQ